MNKAILPYDVYERHRKISEFITDDETVLDVGGELNHLSQFINPKKIVVANLDTGDVIINKDELPFKKNSFDIVCAIDVLEHIPKIQRENFIKNLILIARKKVLVSFPLGTMEHISYEKQMHDYLRKKGVNVAYLKEHIKYGLPQKEDLDHFSKGFKHTHLFSGNLRMNEYLFKLFLFDPKIKFVRKIVYYLKLMFNLLTNQIFYLCLSNKPYSSLVNRAYIIIFK